MIQFWFRTATEPKQTSMKKKEQVQVAEEENEAFSVEYLKNDL